MNKRTLLISLLLVMVMGLLPGMAIADDVAGEAQAAPEPEAAVVVEEEQVTEAADQGMDAVAEQPEAAQPESANELEVTQPEDAPKPAVKAAPPAETKAAEEASEMQIQEDGDEGEDVPLDSLSLEKYTYIATGNPVELLVGTVYDVNDEEVPSDCYSLVFYTQEWNSELEQSVFVPFEGIPSEPGHYYVAATGTNGYTGESGKSYFRIVAVNDLSGAEADWTSTYRYTGDPIVVQITFTYDGDELTEGEDYVLKYEIKKEDGSSEELDGAPTAIGTYYVYAAAIGETFYGESSAYEFSIVDALSLDGGRIDLGTTSYGATDNPVELAVSGVYNVDDEEVSSYTLVYYDENENPLEGAPTGIGDYMVAASGVDPYCGETNKTWFYIVEAEVDQTYDLTGGYIDLETNTYAFTGNPVVLDISEVVNGNGDSLNDGAYQLVYYTAATDSAGQYIFTPFDGIPTAPGSYGVAAKGVKPYTGETPKQHFCIIGPNDLTNGNILLNKETYVYTGEPVELDVWYVETCFEETIPENGYKLMYFTAEYDAAEEEYVYEEFDGIPQEPGDYGVAAKGIDTYEGQTFEQHFRIAYTTDLSAADLLINGSNTVAYTGSPVSFEFAVRLADGNELDSSKYDVVYYDEDENKLSRAPKDIGEWYISAAAKDGSGYTGETRKVWFRIVDTYDLSSALVYADDVAYTGSPVTPATRVSIGDKTVPKSAYTLVFYEYEGVWDEEIGGYEYIELDGAPTKIGKYRVAAVGEDPYYGESDPVSFAIYDKYDLSLAYLHLSKDTYAATGNPVEPKDTYVYDRSADDNLPKTAYELVYYDANGNKLAGAPAEEGAYRVAAKGISPYKNETEPVPFTIVPWNNLAGADIDFVKSQTMAEIQRMFAVGTNMDENMTVTLNGTSLGADDYTLRYEQYLETGGWTPLTAYPTEIGSYRVYAEAIGDTYEGKTGKAYFQLRAKNCLLLADATLTKNAYAYTGSGIIPSLVVKMDGKVVDASEYDLCYISLETGEESATAPVAVGSYYVFAQAKASSHYTERTWSLTFTIGKASIKNAKLVLSKTSFTFNNKVQKPIVKTVGGKSLKAGTDYTVSYSNANSKNAGSYTVTVTGKGNYTGTSAKATYKIAKAKNPLVAKAKSKNAVTVKVGKSLGAKKLYKVSKNQGKVTYAKGNKAGGKKLVVAKNGKITAKKGVKKGTYKVKVKVMAAGNNNYKKLTKTITVTIKVG